jgi:hypothetical protein
MPLGSPVGGWAPDNGGKGIAAGGRWAAITNYRDPATLKADAPSRAVVSELLRKPPPGLVLLVGAVIGHWVVTPLAVTQHWIPAEAVALFDELSFAPGLLEMLPGEAPARWEHPVVLAESCFGHAPLGAVFSCAPEPGVLDVSDVGRAGRREGASRAGLAQHTDPAELDALGRAFDRAGAVARSVVDDDHFIGLQRLLAEGSQRIAEKALGVEGWDHDRDAGLHAALRRSFATTARAMSPK